jgi:predicted transcriptional regulator
MENASTDYVCLSADVISAYVSNNRVSPGDLPALIQSVYEAITTTANGKQEPQPEALVPPVSVKKSIQHDHLISMEDGRGYRSLRRHLSARGLTPEQYRVKWNLPHDYPMVSPGYSAARSEMAKALGLGQKRKGTKKGANKKAA